MIYGCPGSGIWHASDFQARVLPVREIISLTWIATVEKICPSYRRLGNH
jgi:hypothetical protein